MSLFHLIRLILPPWLTFLFLQSSAEWKQIFRIVQVREENPILYSHKTQLNIKLSLLQHYNMFRPKLSAIFRLYMKPI